MLLQVILVFCPQFDPKVSSWTSMSLLPCQALNQPSQAEGGGWLGRGAPGLEFRDQETGSERSIKVAIIIISFHLLSSSSAFYDTFGIYFLYFSFHAIFYFFSQKKPKVKQMGLRHSECVWVVFSNQCGRVPQALLWLQVNVNSSQ